MIASTPAECIYQAMGPTDMQNGFDDQSMTAQELLQQGPFWGHLFELRGRRGDLGRSSSEGDDDVPCASIG